VFLCHGTPSSRLNRPTTRPLARWGARLIVIDRPGCGFVGFPSSTHAAGLARRLASGRGCAFTLRALLWSAFSGGGPYVAASAYGLPDRVLAAASVAGAGPVDAPGALAGLSLYRRAAGGLARMRPAISAAMWLTNHPSRNPGRFLQRLPAISRRPIKPSCATRDPRRSCSPLSGVMRGELRGVALDLALPCVRGLPIERNQVSLFHLARRGDRSTPMTMAIPAQPSPLSDNILPEAGHMFSRSMAGHLGAVVDRWLCCIVTGPATPLQKVLHSQAPDTLSLKAARRDHGQSGPWKGAHSRCSMCEALVLTTEVVIHEQPNCVCWSTAVAALCPARCGRKNIEQAHLGAIPHYCFVAMLSNLSSPT